MKPPARVGERQAIIEYMQTHYMCEMYRETLACEHSLCYNIDQIIDDLEMGEHID
jgi:hypothetical protein